MTFSTTYDNISTLDMIPIQIGQFWWFNIGGVAKLVKVICFNHTRVVYQVYEQGFWRVKPSDLILTCSLKQFLSESIFDPSI